MSDHRINRVRRLVILGIMSFVILLITTLFLGFVLHHEISMTYTQNYQALMDAGVVDIIAAPEVISHRLLLLVTIFPLIGAGLVGPLFLLALKEILSLAKEPPVG